MWGQIFSTVLPAVIGKVAGGGNKAPATTPSESSNGIGGMDILKLLAPFLVGGVASKIGGSSKATPSAASSELERLALERVRAAQPLYQQVMAMAQARLPRSTPRVGAQPRQIAAPPAAAIPQDQYAQSIVDEFRKRTGREY